MACYCSVCIEKNEEIERLRRHELLVEDQQKLELSERDAEIAALKTGSKIAFANRNDRIF